MMQRVLANKSPSFSEIRPRKP